MGALQPACGRDSAEVAIEVVDERGGVVSSVDGVLSLTILPGALSNSTTIEIFESDAPPLLLSPAYRVKPDIPVSIDIEVTYRRRLPSDPEDTTVGAIHVEDYEEGAGNWVALPRTELDVERQLVRGSDSEIALYYGLLEDGSGPPVADDGASDDDASDSGSDSGGTQGLDDSSDSGSMALSHAADIQPIWDESCALSNCHEAGGSSPLLADDAYDRIVEVLPLTASVNLVTPGDPERSYLYHKIAGTHLSTCECGGSGQPMPASGELLTAGTISLIRRWIEQGAPE